MAARLLPPATALPELPPSLPRQGHPRWLRALGRWVMTVLGWRFVGGFPDVPKLVLVGAPHTSTVDGIVGLGAAAWADLAFSVFAKRQLFRWPLTPVLRAFGGVPVDRDAPGGLVGRAVEVLRGPGPAVVALTPEGTRGPVSSWKTGFYRIAVEADVPIAVVGIDFKRRELRIPGAIVPTGDLDADLAVLGDLLAGVEGRHPERGYIPAGTARDEDAVDAGSRPQAHS